MKRFALVFLTLLAQSAWAQLASFNPADNTLTLPRITVTGSSTFENVVVTITNLGTVRVDDPAVGSQVTFDAASNTLYLPQVQVGSTVYSGVSLSGLAVVVRQVGGVVVDSGSGGWVLDLAVTAAGVASPAIRIDNIAKPSTQAEFCSPEIYQQFQQNVQGVSGSWGITSCSFDGTTGNISAVLNLSAPLVMTVPYSVRYTYSTR